nr:uncharacterized protein LOC109164055 [Ipomoea trifida]
MNLMLIKELKAYLDDAFKIKDLGELGYFMEIKARSNKAGLNLCHHKYALDILVETGYLECKPTSTLMVPGLHLNHKDGEPLSDICSYRRLVGQLLYLTATRPDIAYAVQQLSQFVDSPTYRRMNVVYRVLCYIKRAPGQGFFYPKHDDLQLNVFSDSDSTSCSETRQSITCYCLFLGSALVSGNQRNKSWCHSVRSSVGYIPPK